MVNFLQANDGGFNLKCAYFATNGACTLIAGATTWEITGNNAGVPWSYGSGGTVTFTLNAAHILKFSDTSNTSNRYNFNKGNAYPAITLKNVWFARGASTGDNFFDGNLTMTDLKDTGTAAHSLYFTWSLLGGSYTFTTLTISGSAGHLITFATSNGSAPSANPHSLKCSSGTISCDYLSISRSNASGGASFYAGANSTDGGNNSGWIFTAPPLANLKTFDGLAKASIKTINGLAIGSVKTVNGLT